MSDQKKIYLGNGTLKTFNDGGYIINASICLSDIPKGHIKTANNGKKYLNINLGAKREIDPYGNTHWIAVDTWKPTENPNAGKPVPALPMSAPPTKEQTDGLYAGEGLPSNVVETQQGVEDLPF